METALALGVKALADAMGRAPAEELSKLSERLSAVVAELTARRAARETARPAGVIALDDERRRRGR